MLNLIAGKLGGGACGSDVMLLEASFDNQLKFL